MKWSFLNIKVLFFTTLITLSALSFFSFRQLQSFIDLTNAVNHNNTFRLELEKQISLLKDAETGQRGFLLTGDSSFLEPYFFALYNSELNLRKLDSLTDKNPEQKKNIVTLALLINNRLNYSTRILQKNQYQDLTKNDFIEGKNLMNLARNHVKRMMDQEEKNLEQKKRTLQRSSKITPLVNIALVCFSIVLLLFAYSKIQNELKASKNLQYQLQISENQLKITLDELEKNKARQIEFVAAKRFELIANTMPQFIWTSGADGKINYFSQSFYEGTGTSSLILQNDQVWLSIMHASERAENERLWRNSIENGTPFLNEHRFLMKDGKYRWHLSRAVPQKDENGNIQMWVGTSTDIEDQKMFAQELDYTVQRKTKELKKANVELEKSNAELAQFAYIASHDLQEPLRKIQTFISRLVDTESSLSEKSKDYFFRIQRSSKKMQQLITDILSYSRTSHSEETLTLTDLNKIFESVKEQLAEVIDQKSAIITNNDFPSIPVIPFQIEQLFTNLLSNALKFSKKECTPVIKVQNEVVHGNLIQHKDADPSIDYHVITISDNGVGFEPAFNERIFGVFQRLHSREDFAGTGIGLSIVKKIVENHHGFITAYGKLNEGATFVIYLPA